MTMFYEGPLVEACRAEFLRLFDRLLEELAVVDARAADAVRLHWLAGMTQEKAGACLGVTRDVIAHAIKRARDFFQRHLGGDWKTASEAYLVT